MTNASLNDILTAINQFDPHHVLVGALAMPAATGGTTTTLVDNLRLLDGYRGTLYAGGHVTFAARTGSNRHRRIDTDVPLTGTWAWSAPLPFASPITTDDSYLAWTILNPMRVEGAINRALERMRHVEQVDIAGVDGQRQYALATDFAWLTSPRDELALYLRRGDTALQYRYRELPQDDWVVTEDNGVYTLDLLGATYAATDVLRLDCLRPYASPLTGIGYLAGGADTTPAPLRWVLAETILEMLQSMSTLEWGPEAGLLEQRRGQARLEANRWRQRMAPVRARPIFATAGANWQAATGGIA